VINDVRGRRKVVRNMYPISTVYQGIFNQLKWILHCKIHWCFLGIMVW